VRLIAVGRAGPADGEAALVARYVARIRPRLAVTELAEQRGAPAEARRREGEALLAALDRDAHPRSWAVALDLGGAAPDTETFAALLERWLAQPRPVCFLIGGAEGLDRAVLERADYVLSLGRLTWPHLLARAMLAEQIYRARAIAGGHPYHRARRP
jgi:23S rRNA (pseudouridine1915-N3)-methyltransferase